jgi:hypothetical protein
LPAAAENFAQTDGTPAPLSGAAGALLTTGSLSLLRSTFGEQSGRAVGIWMAAGG